MRSASISRATKETSIDLSLNLDQAGAAIEVPSGFFAHMLDALARHSGLGLKVTAKGDTEVDLHHTTEDVGIVMGQALNKALGDKRGIERYGLAKVPMDEALVEAVIDISGRPFFVLNGQEMLTGKAGEFDLELVPEFLRAFSFNAGICLHMTILAGSNGHHTAEACFKALARALKQAVKIVGDEMPSTKESL